MFNDVKSIQSRGIPSLLNTQKFPEEFANKDKEKEIAQENERDFDKDDNYSRKENIVNERKDSSSTSKYNFKFDGDREGTISGQSPNKLVKKQTTILEKKKDIELEEDPPYEPEEKHKVTSQFDEMGEYIDDKDFINHNDMDLNEGGMGMGGTGMGGMSMGGMSMGNNMEDYKYNNEEFNKKMSDKSISLTKKDSKVQGFDNNLGQNSNNENDIKSYQDKPFTPNTDGNNYSSKYSGTGNNTQEEFLKSAQNFKDSQIVQIVKGKHHLLKLTIDGKVYGLGKSYFGVVGLGGSAFSLKPKVIPNLANIKISQIACGMFHSLALARNGDLYSWGMGFEGQLGLSNPYKIASSPRYVNFFYKKPVKFITCGHNYSLCITNDSRLWGWGENKLGQLGLGKVQVVDKPTEIPILDVPGNQEGCSRPDNILNGNFERKYSGLPLKACFAAAGFSHSVVVTEEGNVLTFGLNIYGQLGNILIF